MGLFDIFRNILRLPEHPDTPSSAVDRYVDGRIPNPSSKIGDVDDAFRVIDPRIDLGHIDLNIEQNDLEDVFRQAAQLFASSLPDFQQFFEQTSDMFKHFNIESDETDMPRLHDAPIGEKKSLRDEYFKPGYIVENGRTEKVDEDLDGKVNARDLQSFLQGNDTKTDQLVPVQPHHSFPSPVIEKYTFSSSSVSSFGKTEQVKTVRDKNGNEERTVTRKIGDQMHRVITLTEPTGQQTTTEEFVNMDKDQIQNFEALWANKNLPSDNPSAPNQFVWKIFK